MFRFSDMRIRFKLILLFIITGSIPLVIIGYLGTELATDTLMDKSFNHDNAVTWQVATGPKQRDQHETILTT